MYEIVTVTWPPVGSEHLGTKRKFWFEGPCRLFSQPPDADAVCGETSKYRMLFKAEERGTGEDWAEKVASELCELLGLPHVPYHLAEESGTAAPGAICPTCAPGPSELILGNELLHRIDPDYAGKDGRRRAVRQHTVKTVSGVLRGIRPAGEPPPYVRRTPRIPGATDSALDVFTGYAILDCWIANQDRHHENWGVISNHHDARSPLALAPTFDHGASLARNLSDGERAERLETKDGNRTVATFARKAKSALYAAETSQQTLTTYGAWRLFAEASPAAARFWLDRLREVTEEQVRAILGSVPAHRLSAWPGQEFTARLLAENRRRLLGEVDP